MLLLCIWRSGLRGELAGRGAGARGEPGEWFRDLQCEKK